MDSRIQKLISRASTWDMIRVSCCQTLIRKTVTHGKPSHWTRFRVHRTPQASIRALTQRHTTVHILKTSGSIVISPRRRSGSLQIRAPLARAVLLLCQKAASRLALAMALSGERSVTTTLTITQRMRYAGKWASQAELCSLLHLCMTVTFRLRS